MENGMPARHPEKVRTGADQAIRGQAQKSDDSCQGQADRRNRKRM